MTRVLVLRPEPGASATLRRARERGLDAVAIPLFEIEPVAWQAPQPFGFDGLLLTSANAVRSGGEQLQKLRGLPVYAVGEATAEAARQGGFDIASTGDADIRRLLDSIDPDLKLLHLAGEDRVERGESSQEIRTVTVYRSRAKEDVQLRGVAESVALIHSPRAARRFAKLTDGRAKESIAIAAISLAAADAAGTGWARVEAADIPTDEALLALAERLCNNTAAK
jgi:uroporphyrinogen-III synthase